ncbi:NACHT domain-containing protein [Kitasatospora sp. NPDC006697]|uniref:NACHT domain-containing protein n=1 Tax=Kitasatospora sp. NPDC006697 TaxID=3364020 RepID=UPI0036CF41D8
MTELADALRRLLVQRGLTVYQLTLRSGLGRTTVSQALNGGKLPSERTVIALASALGAHPGPLLELRRTKSGPTSPNFEQQYRDYLVARHSHLDIIGLDLSRPDRAHWPLDTAYLSLELADSTPQPFGEDRVHRVQRAEQALAGKQRILVRGQAGSGKTTLLQWLAVATAQGTLPEELDHLRGGMPFLLPLRRLVRSELPGPERFLEGPLAAGQPKGWVHQILSAGSGLVLVDGLDEVRQRDRAEALDWLRALIAAYPESFFAATTRPGAVAEGILTGQQFAELTVRPMSPADVSVFVTRWHDAARVEASPEEHARLDELEVQLLDSVRAQRDLAQLTTTPLLCALVCALHRDRRGQMPHGRKALYEAALSMLMIRRDRERNIGAPEGVELDEYQATELLQRLAYWMINNGLVEADFEDAAAKIESALPAMPEVAEQGNARQVLTHLISRSGLLRQPTAETVDFIHRTFQDFLGAKAAVASLDFRSLVSHAVDDQWEDVVRMAVALARPGEAASMLRQLVDGGDKSTTHETRLHLLAAACMEQVTVLDPAVRAAVERRLKSLLPPQWYGAMERIAACGPMVLDLLPGPEELNEIERGLVVETAVKVGGAAALPLLKNFRSFQGRNLWSTLGRVWEDPRISTDEYVHEVLSHHPGEGSIAITTIEQLHAMSEVPAVTGIEFNGPFTDDDIAGVKHLGTCQSLMLRGIQLRSLEFLLEHPGITYLYLTDCQIEEGLTSIENMALQGLQVFGTPHHDLTVVSRLNNLHDLSIGQPLGCASLRSFQAPRGLTWLSLVNDALSATSLDGISLFSELEGLVVEPQNHQGLSEITELPKLRTLSLISDSLRELPTLADLQVLYITGAIGSLSKVPQAFPSLQEFSITCGSQVSLLDLAPLHDLPQLKQVTITGSAHLENIDLPASVTLRLHR